MADKKWNELGEEIRDAVNGAVLSGDFSGLSRSLGDLVENAVKTADEKARQANDPRQMSRGQTASGGGTQPAWYAKKPQGLGGSIAMMVIGYVLLIIGLILVMCSAILLTVSRVFVIFLLLFLVMVAGGLWLGFSGTSKMILISRFRQYTRQMGWQLCVPVQSLADKCGRDVKTVIKDLRKMMKEHMFFEAHLDEKEGYLLLTDKAFEEYNRTKQEAWQRQKEMEKAEKMQKQLHQQETVLPEECRRMIDDGQSYVEYIRSCNDAIPGEEISRKLDRMEGLIQRIFDQVRKNPQMTEELEKMMDYYLPTTAKLLDAYRELDAQPVAGENVSKTKKEIEDAIDTLNTAFEKLLDGLFADTAWDISSDISVLHTMLAQEGLTENDFQKK